jgi:hypothetical protein
MDSSLLYNMKSQLFFFFFIFLPFLKGKFLFDRVPNTVPGRLVYMIDPNASEPSQNKR